MNARVFKHSQAHKLEDPERLKWLPPAEVISRLHLVQGTRVADVGAGTGYFGIPIAKAVGESGHVYAVDLQEEMLGRLREKLQQPGVSTNITLHRGSASALPLPDHSVDFAFYANVWHELDDQQSTFHDALRVTRPGGKIAILDWRSDRQSPPGPPQDHRISAETMVNFLQTNGCRHVSCYNIGDFSYMITAELPQAKE